MRKSSLTLLAAVIGLAAGHASAADLTRFPPPAPAYVPPAPFPYRWTGCYVGGNIGGAWANVELSNVATGGTVSASNSGVAGGGQIGCDFQAGEWVFGFRNMFDATSLSNSGGTNWFDTLTAREGYLVQPNILLYVQGGAAWTNTSELSNNRTGWTVGGGAEWVFAPHWSVFAEYNFMGFGSVNIQDALVGVNYKF